MPDGVAISARTIRPGRAPQHSSRSHDREAQRAGPLGHSTVVGDDRAQYGCHEVSRCEMDGIERSEADGLEHPGGVEEGVVESDQVDALQQAPGGGNCGGPDGPHRAQDFRASEPTRHALRLAPQVRSEGA